MVILPFIIRSLVCIISSTYQADDSLFLDYSPSLGFFLVSSHIDRKIERPTHHTMKTIKIVEMLLKNIFKKQAKKVTI